MTTSKKPIALAKFGNGTKRVIVLQAVACALPPDEYWLEDGSVLYVHHWSGRWCYRREGSHTATHVSGRVELLVPSILDRCFLREAIYLVKEGHWHEAVRLWLLVAKIWVASPLESLHWKLKRE